MRYEIIPITDPTIMWIIVMASNLNTQFSQWFFVDCRFDFIMEFIECWSHIDSLRSKSNCKYIYYYFLEIHNFLISGHFFPFTQFHLLLLSTKFISHVLGNRRKKIIFPKVMDIFRSVVDCDWFRIVNNFSFSYRFTELAYKLSVFFFLHKNRHYSFQAIHAENLPRGHWHHKISQYKYESQQLAVFSF